MGQAKSRAKGGAKGAGQLGFVAGSAAGAVPGAVVGAVGGLISAAIYGENRAGHNTMIAIPKFLTHAYVGGRLTGAAVGAVVAVPCAVIGAALGAMGGAAEDMTLGAMALGQITNKALADMKEGRIRASQRDSPAANLQVAQLPDEALPLLCALTVAQRCQRISQDEAVKRAAAFAATCCNEEPKPQLIARAEAAGRVVLTYVKLSEAFPGETSAAVQAAAEALVSAANPDAIDAVWIVCGTKPLHHWSPEVRAALPSRVSEISPQLLIHGLELKYQHERDSIIDAIQRFFPGGLNRDAYSEAVDSLWSSLPKASFWKANLILQRGRLPQEAQGLTFQHLQSSEFWVVAKDFLASSSALCTPQHEHGASESLGAMLLHADSGEFESRLVTAAFRARKPLCGADAPDHQTIQVEIFTAKDLGSAQYRAGDFTKSLFGARRMSPYIEVKYASERALTRVVQCQEKRADFGERVCFQYCGNSSEGQRVEFNVYDARQAQAVIRGDPLIGGASTILTQQTFSGSPQLQTLQLLRDRNPQGELVVRIGFIAPQSAYAILAESKDQPLAEVALAVGQILAQPHGVDILLKAMPRQSESLSDGASDADGVLRQTLKSWILRLNAATKRSEGLADEAALSYFAVLARSAQQIVAAVNEDLDGDEVMTLTATWVVQVISCCYPEGAPPNLDVARLLRLLDAGRSNEGDPKEVLQALGVSLPEETSLEIVQAVASRLQEAERNNEEETFTGAQIVENGIVAQGMSAITRMGQSGRCHVFIYDLASIQRWQRERGSNPTTRERISASDILRLTGDRG